MKKIQLLFTLLFFTFSFTGCVHQLNKKGIVLSVSQSQINDSFKDSFPFKKDFTFGILSLDNPKFKIPKKSNRIQVGINLELKTLFTNAIGGNFSLSGEPEFKKENKAIYLKNVTLKDFNFGKLRIGDEFSNTFRMALQPMINKIFSKYPIYTIPEDSIQGSFIKDVKIVNSQLLITYGI